MHSSLHPLGRSEEGTATPIAAKQPVLIYRLSDAAPSLGSEPESGSFIAANRQQDVDMALEQAEQMLGIPTPPPMQLR